MRNNRFLYAIGMSLALLVLLGGDCFAADAAGGGSGNIIDTALAAIKDAAKSTVEGIKPFGLRLFYALSVISLTWCIGKRMFVDADIGSFFHDLISWVVVTGCWLYILKNATAILDSIIKSFETMASRLSAGGATSASGIISQGFGLFEIISRTGQPPSMPELIAKGAWYGMGETVADVLMSILPMWILAFGMLFILAIIGIIMMMKFATVYMLIFTGYFYFAFSGCEWTRPIARRYINSVLSAGVELFTVLLSFALFEKIMTGILNEIQTAIASTGKALTFQACAVMLCSMMVVGYLVHSLPSILGGVVNGVMTNINVPFSESNVKNGALIAVRVVIHAGAAIASGGSSAVGSLAGELAKAAAKEGVKRGVDTVINTARRS